MNKIIHAVIYFSIFVFHGCIFSSTEYEGKIIIDKYILTKTQVSALFSNNIVKQKTYKDLKNEKVFIVLMLTNIGNKGAWGQLEYNVDDYYKRSVNISTIGPGKRNSAIIVLPYSGILNPTNIDTPNIMVSWKSLNTK